MALLSFSTPSLIDLRKLNDLASWRELADLHRKAVYDVLERNISHLDGVLETLTIDRYSMSVVSVLLVKMNQIYTDSMKDRVRFFILDFKILMFSLLLSLYTNHIFKIFMVMNNVSSDMKLHFTFYYVALLVSGFLKFYFYTKSEDGLVKKSSLKIG